jgi:Leucine-rich repeat (LRR) protein
MAIGAAIAALVAVGCGEKKVDEPVVEQPAEPVVDLKEQCKVFEPPWGAGSWTEWGQSNPEEGERWYTSIGDIMKRADFALLPRCKHLENVFVGMSELTDLAPLSGLTGIKRLDLRFVEQLEDLKPLESLVNLEYLNITGTGVTDLTPLTKLPKLHTLEARTLKLSDASAVAAMKALYRVDFLKCPITDLTPMAQAPQLAEILVCNTQVEALEPLVPIKDRVRALDLCRTRFEDYDKLAEFDKLTALRLSNKPIADLTPLAGMTRMEKLDINGTEVKDLTPIKGMTAMKQLDLSELELTDLSALYGMQQLEKLYVVKSKFDPKLIEELKQKLPKVEVVEEY